MENKKIVLLVGKGLSTTIVFNALNKKFGVTLAIIEEKERALIFLKRRIKRLGFIKVFGQISFELFIAKPLSFFSEKRRSDIINENQLDTTEIRLGLLKKVKSINSAETIEAIKIINPDLIIVNGTRIISKKVLSSVSCKFINTHAGITPKYRGVHGMYWALINDDEKNSGVTVHFVDEGIDTGNVIYQRQVLPTIADNFSTYPLLQLAEGIKILLQAVESYFDGSIIVNDVNTESNLWYHPTIWSYIYNRITKGIK
jgi:folate-dependent phosphoribosylglycinamide formyltransferase PurN